MSVAARSERFAPDDDRWLSQTRLLHQDLAHAAERLALRTRETPGAKGGGLDVLVVLTPAVLTAFVAALRAWMSRDRDRSALVRYRVGDQVTELTVTVQDGDTATLQAALEHGLRAAGHAAAEPCADGAEERQEDIDARE